MVSTPDARAAEMAGREGIPLVLLDERAGPGQTTAFPLIHSAEARAVALARRALALVGLILLLYRRRARARRLAT